VVILGGPARLTLEAAIYDAATASFDLRTAAALSLVQLVAVAAIVAVSSRLEARAGLVAPLGAEETVAHRPRGVERAALAASLARPALFLGAPLVALVRSSFDAPGGVGLAFYRALGHDTPSLLVRPWHAVLNSLGYASAATAIAVVMGGLAASVI